MVGERSSDISNIIFKIDFIGAQTFQRRMNQVFSGMRKQFSTLSGQQAEVMQSSKRMADSVIDSQIQQKKAGKALASKLNDPSEQARRLAASHDSLRGSMALTVPQMKKINDGNAMMKTRMGRLGWGIRTVTHGLRGFRMEMLGVMFFGMAMTRMFGGMLKPTAQLFGIFDLWKVLLQVTFLPIMEKLFPLFLSFFEWVLSWSEDTKVLVGVLTIFGLLLGSFLMLFGMIALGLGSVIMAFGPLLTVFLAGMSALLPIMAVFIGLGLIVAGAVMIIQGRMEGIGLVIMGVGLILALFIGWWALIPIAVGAAVFLIIKHWSSIKHFFKVLWIDIKILFIKGMAAITKTLMDSTFLNWMTRLLGFDMSFDAAVDGIVDMLEAEKSLVNAQYETDKALAGTGEEAVGLGQTIKDQIAGMSKSTVEGNKEMSSSFETGFDYSTWVVEDRTALMAGKFDEGMGDMVSSSARSVQAINNNLNNIGRGRGGSAALQTEASAVDSLIAYGTSQEGGWRDPSAGVVIHQTNNVQVSDFDEWERRQDERDRTAGDRFAIAPQA